MLLGLGVSSECVQRATATGRTNFAILLRLSQDGYGCISGQSVLRNWEDTTCKSTANLVPIGKSRESLSLKKKKKPREEAASV